MGFTCALHSVTVYLVRGHYVKGLELFEGRGVEAVMGEVCSRCPPKV